MGGIAFNNDHEEKKNEMSVFVKWILLAIFCVRHA